MTRIFCFLFTALLYATALYAADPLPKVPTVDQAISRAAKAAPLRWQFTGNTPKDLASWQKQFRAKIGELLGPHAPPGTFSSKKINQTNTCLLYTSPSPRDATLSRMPSSA